MEGWAPRFEAYFQRPVAQQAAKPLSNGIQVEIRIELASGQEIESMTFTRHEKTNVLLPQAADSPEIIFWLTPQAAEQILSDPTEEVGAIGVGIGKLLVSQNSKCRAKVKLKAGFLTLYSRGYFGVVSSGGASFAAFLAQQGLSGLDKIKSTIKKLKD